MKIYFVLAIHPVSEYLFCIYGTMLGTGSGDNKDANTDTSLTWWNFKLKKNAFQAGACLGQRQCVWP